MQDRIIRFAIFLIFAVFGIWEIFQPVYWAPFVPQIISFVFNPLFIVRLHGVVLLILGALLLLGIKRNIVVLASLFVMANICLSVFILLGFSDTLIRDLVIFICIFSLLFPEPPKTPDIIKKKKS